MEWFFLAGLIVLHFGVAARPLVQQLIMLARRTLATTTSVVARYAVAVVAVLGT